MPGVARKGDLYGPGGVLLSPASLNVLVNGISVALSGIVYSPHLCCGIPKCSPLHCFGTVSAPSRRVKVNGKTPVLLGNKGTCGHTVTKASKNVRIGKK